MTLDFNKKLLTNIYTSNSQIAKLITENWVESYSYCPSCNNDYLVKFANNNPVGDFYCNNCQSEYELKSKKNNFARKINDGAYSKMIERIHSENNPHFFFLNYSLANFQVTNFIVIPKHYFINDIIEKRKPLSNSARRAGWIGCNILLENIPSTGKIFLIKDGTIQKRESVIDTWKKTEFLAHQSGMTKGWTIETLKVLELIKEKDFNIDKVYQFVDTLKTKFPNNQFIKEKLRQQLQVLRDKGLVEFKGRGHYRKLF